MDTPPLAGLRVLELAGVLAGPAVGMFLAELGADVVKLENPGTGGDVTRGWLLPGEVPRRPGVSAYFTSVNWGKRSIAIDLSESDGRDLALELARRSDVVLTSFRPGQAERIGLGPQALEDANPRAVLAEVTAFGPGDDRPGYDALLQAATGFMAMNGTDGSGPLKMPVALIDLLAAHQLKEALLLALLVRERTGRGRRLSVSLLRSGLASLANQAAGWLVCGRRPALLGSGHPSIVPYGEAWECAHGGSIVLAVGTDRQFGALCAVLGFPELADDPRFATNAARVTNRDALRPRLAPRIRETSREVLLAALAAAGVPAGPLLDVAEALGAPGAAPLLMSSDGVTGVRSVAVDLGLARVEELRPPPALSRDAREILRHELGLDAARIAALLASGVVLDPEDAGV